MLKRTGAQPPLTENRKNGVLYFTFPALDAQPEFIHGFSSRIGGVSENELSTMNLSFTRGDREERVRENFHRIAQAIGFDEKQMVFSYQTHTVNIRRVTGEDRGKGYLRERDYRDVDGLITDEPGVILTTFYADCVPLFFVDPVHRAAGLAHSGWRGTVNNIAGETVRRMQDAFGTKPEELLACIGPSICSDCYEVSEDVADQFRARYPQELWPRLLRPRQEPSPDGRLLYIPGKYQLDLWEACRQNMLRAGILSGHIQVTDICTCCNPDILFSHRASHGKRGNLAAFLGIR